ncbi:unnamed protein product, partial [Polarella glacialis]
VSHNMPYQNERPSLERQQSGSQHFDDPVIEGEWWPPPLTEQDVAIRQRASRLLEALRRIPTVYYDIKAWENEHELAFSLFRRGCLDGAASGTLEAPIYNNRQIEDAWLFLLEMRRRHFNRRKHIQECARILGASYNWSMVLHGSKKVQDALRELPEDIRMEVLEDAEALDLLPVVTPNHQARGGSLDGTPPGGLSPGSTLPSAQAPWPSATTPEGGGWPPAPQSAIPTFDVVQGSQ